MSGEQHTALVRRFIDEFWNQGNLAVADELLAPEVAARYKDRAAQIRAQVPDVEITIEEMVADGDLVATFETVHGNHRRGGGEPLLHLLVPPDQTAPRRKPVTFSRAVFYRVVGGKLTVLRQIGDNLGLFQQLGGLPPVMPDSTGTAAPEATS